jgi:acylglycerol lipase
MEYENAVLTTADGTQITTYSWIPNIEKVRGNIIIVHGYGEHAGRYQHVATYFTEQGYAVYAADLRGHGRSRGKIAGYFPSIDTLRHDLHEVVEWARNHHPQRPVFMIGHSVGGLLALHYTATYQPFLKGLVISAPYVNTEQEITPFQRFAVRQVAQFAPKLGVTNKVNSQWLSKDPAVWNAYDSDPYVYHGKVPAHVAVELVEAGDAIRAELSKIALPVLILQGRQDELAKPHWAQYIYENIASPDKQIKIYEGLKHEILNEPEKARVMADIWVWIAAHHGTGELKPLKS